MHLPARSARSDARVATCPVDCMPKGATVAAVCARPYLEIVREQRCADGQNVAPVHVAPGALAGKHLCCACPRRRDHPAPAQERCGCSGGCGPQGCCNRRGSRCIGPARDGGCAHSSSSAAGETLLLRRPCCGGGPAACLRQSAIRRCYFPLRSVYACSASRGSTDAPKQSSPAFDGGSDSSLPLYLGREASGNSKMA